MCMLSMIDGVVFNYVMNLYMQVLFTCQTKVYIHDTVYCIFHELKQQQQQRLVLEVTVPASDRTTLCARRNAKWRAARRSARIDQGVPAPSAYGCQISHEYRVMCIKVAG